MAERAAVGQVWESKDRRESRRVRVVELPTDPTAVGARAVVQQVDARGLPMPKARWTRIRLDHRGRLAGYRPVED